jgi:hypothetical protein
MAIAGAANATMVEERSTPRHFLNSFNLMFPTLTLEQQRASPIRPALRRGSAPDGSAGGHRLTGFCRGRLNIMGSAGTRREPLASDLGAAQT